VSPLNNGERVGSPLLWVVAGTMTAAAAGLTLSALFPSYYRGAPSLVSSSSNLWYNIPAIAGWLVATLLLVPPRTRYVGAALTAGLSFVWLSAYVSDIGQVVTGASRPAAGFILGVLGIGFALVGAASAVWAATRLGARLAARRGVAPWAMAAGAVGIAFAIGTAMNWREVQVHATTLDWTFKATGTATLVESCCTVLDAHEWSLAGEVLLMVLAVIVPIVALAFTPVRFSISALVGAAIALTAGPLSGVAWLTQPVTASSLGIPSSQAQQGAYLFSQHGLPGLWVALLAPLALGLLALGRGFHASTRAPTDGIASS
jgi:hypothetical protein